MPLTGVQFLASLITIWFYGNLLSIRIFISLCDDFACLTEIDSISGSGSGDLIDTSGSGSGFLPDDDRDGIVDIDDGRKGTVPDWLDKSGWRPGRGRDRHPGSIDGQGQGRGDINSGDSGGTGSSDMTGGSRETCPGCLSWLSVVCVIFLAHAAQKLS